MPKDTGSYDTIISSMSIKYRVPVEWIKAVIGTESSWNPEAYRWEPARNEASWGLMQLLESTARWMGYSGEPEGLFNPAVNIEFGTKYMAWIIKRWKTTDFRAMYSAYNSGSPTKWTTSEQVKTHVSNAVAWLERYGGKLVELALVNTVPITGAVILVISLIAWRSAQ